MGAINNTDYELMKVYVVGKSAVSFPDLHYFAQEINKSLLFVENRGFHLQCGLKEILDTFFRQTITLKKLFLIILLHRVESLASALRFIDLVESYQISIFIIWFALHFSSFVT